MLRELQEEISQKDTGVKELQEALRQRDVYITQVTQSIQLLIRFADHNQQCCTFEFQCHYVTTKVTKVSVSLFYRYLSNTSR